jgi:hypothetical protein
LPAIRRAKNLARDAAAVLTEADDALLEYEILIRRINRTNAATTIGADGTLTDALAHRDALRDRRTMSHNGVKAEAPPTLVIPRIRVTGISEVGVVVRLRIGHNLTAADLSGFLTGRIVHFAAPT